MQTIRTNLKLSASSQYANFNHNSMCRFNGTVLGAGADGLFNLTGSDDAGVPIDAYFIPVMTELGSMNQKTCRYVYVGMQCTGSMQVTITGDEKTTIGPYNLLANASEGQQRRRTSVGRGLSFTYGSFRVSNVDGCAFSVDLIQVLVDIKDHGVR